MPHSTPSLSTVILVLIAGCATSTRSRVSPRSVIEAKFAAVNRHAVEDIANLYASDAEITASDFCAPRRGRADVRRTYRGFFDVYPSIGVDVREILVEGDRVAVRLTVRSRPPGVTFDVPIMDFFTVRHGLIESDDGIFDVHGRPCSP